MGVLMKEKSTCKKIIALFIIFVLLSGLVIVLPISASFNRNPDEGLWFDEFENTDNVTLDKCALDSINDSIVLSQSEESLPFDYNNYPDNIDVWYHGLYLLDSLFAKALSKFITPSLIPGTEADASEKNKIGQLDGVVLETTGRQLFEDSTEKEYPLHHFKFEIPPRYRDSQIKLRWWFGDYDEDAHLDEITMYIWKYGDMIPYWGENVTIEYSEENIGETSSNGDISQTIDPDECISDEGYIDVLIIGDPTKNKKPSFLHTDYIDVNITSEYGYVSKGYATSSIISPNNLGRWDRIVWDGSNPTSKSNITIQILDKEDNVIQGYSSKYSPLDISSIEEDEIKIKATLQSSSVDFTPVLDSWAILYYKENDYNDSFSNNYRIDETRGLEIDISSGNVELSNFYSSWPLVGKDSANTRSYDGKTLSKPKDYYWYTESDFVGGKFRGPVVSDGKVYVASVTESRIYAFNEEADKEGELQDFIDRSNKSYLVSSSLAVSDDYVIFGTNNVNKDNNVYFLDKNDLKDEIWKYEPDVSMYFASAPVVDDDRVFITSWSGYSWDLPIFSFFYSYISGNSKLIALDPEAKDTLWEPVDLPASSFSTPAIGEENVFVACQNMYGSNLFAYNLLTGEESWNISVGSPYGIIGRSSPVYNDGKVFILCNERKNVTSFGINKLFAINAENGEMLWNKSMGDADIPSIMNYITSIPSSAPVSSPAFYEDTIYVLSPAGVFYALQPDSGEEVWSFDFSNDTFIPNSYLTSPIVIDDKIYVITGNTINCLNRNKGTKEWSFDIIKPGDYRYEPAPPTIIASPVIADGLMFISGTKNYSSDTGRVYCYGNYTPNAYGYIESTPIYLPEGKWWDNFSADVKDAAKNNTVAFDILDKDKNIIDGFEGLNGSDNSLTNLNTNKIRFSANFNIGNYEESYPVLNSWAVNWVDEKGNPFFDWSDTDGWINNELPDYHVTAEDTEYNGILSGIDANSAKYKIWYIPTGDDKYTNSGWIDAVCSDPSGVKKTTVTAELSKSGIDIDDIKNITFKISDLAGNTNYTDSITLDTDMEDPTSSITNKDELEETGYFNKESENVTIYAEADDTGGSNLRKVILQYRYSNSSEGPWENWTDYTESDSYFTWDFGINEHGGFLKSGFYQIVTVAVDKAGNYEDISDEKIVQFCFDMKLPSIDTSFKDLYEKEEPPIFSFDISDDFKLVDVYYRIDSELTWNIIKSDINKENASIRWTFPKEYWTEMKEDEEHTIYFKVTDLCGNEYASTASESPVIKKNENVSTRYLDISSFSDFHWDNTFLITTQNIPDDIDIKRVILLYQYSKDNETWPENWTEYDEDITEAPYEWEFIPPEDDGYYRFSLEIEDAEGYRYLSSVEQVKIAMFPVLEAVLFITLFILLLITAIYILGKFRAKKK